ncbi:hypothetical protein FHC51_00130 [Leclercia sp. EC_58]|nr:hypothetical protein [Leclercia sp. EC_58]
MEKFNIKDLVKLVCVCVSILFIAVLISYLIVSVIVYFKISVFEFDWREAFSDALRKGIAGGLILAFGIWVKARLQERKKQKRSR